MANLCVSSLPTERDLSMDTEAATHGVTRNKGICVGGGISLVSR